MLDSLQDAWVPLQVGWQRLIRAVSMMRQHGGMEPSRPTPSVVKAKAELVAFLEVAGPQQSVTVT